MPSFNLLVFDLDNTIYDWYSAFLPAFYDMVSEATVALDCNREILLDELQQVHIKYHDVEHPFSLLETKIVQQEIVNVGMEPVLKKLDPAFHAFNKSRKANLKLFPGTLEALNEFARRGIRLIAYTDSKYYAAWGRVQRLGLTDLFERIYCRERDVVLLPPRQPIGPNPSDSDKIVQIPSHESKPNPRVLAQIVKLQNEQLSNVAYVGDSLAKDVLMAKRAGCFAVWAKYGAHTDLAMYERLIRISHLSPSDIQREKNYAMEAKSIRPDFVCEQSLEELLSIVRSPAKSSAPYSHAV